MPANSRRRTTLIVVRDDGKVTTADKARCDRALVLQKGQAVLQGPADAVADDPALAGFLGV